MQVDINQLLFIFGFALVLISLFHLPGLKTELNLADEGYLWFGVMQVLNGKVPIRDFRAYDPGRYYWLALLASLFGRKLLVIRLGLLFSQLIALGVALVIVYSVSEKMISVIFAGFILAFWMFPRHKQIDIMFSMTTPFFAVLLAVEPGTSIFILSGCYLSICFLFGLNHGLYASASLFLVMSCLLLGQKINLMEFLFWEAVILGLAAFPVLLMFFFISGYFGDYWEQKISRILKRGTANLPLPIPFLWKKAPFKQKNIESGEQWLIKSLFTFLPVLYISVIIFVLLLTSSITPQHYSWLALSFCGLCYLHHAYSRADLSHLAQSIAPFILLVTIIASEFSYWWIAGLVFAVLSMRYIYWNNQIWIRAAFKRYQVKEFDIGEVVLKLPIKQAAYIERVRTLVDTYSEKGDSVVLLPKILTLYPMMQRKAAVYDIFCVYTASQLEQARMIKEIKSSKSVFVLIHNVAMDQRAELCFERTHPAVWAYLKSAWHCLSEKGLPLNHYAFIPKTEN